MSECQYDNASMIQCDNEESIIALFIRSFKIDSLIPANVSFANIFLVKNATLFRFVVLLCSLISSESRAIRLSLLARYYSSDEGFCEM